LRIKISSVQSTVTNLSGGNQQKIVIGKWISIHPKLLILDEPTRGIDVQSKMEIYSLLRSLSESGMGIIVLSSDLIELIGISDRMVIFFEGKISGIINSLDFSEEVVMAYATGTSLTGVQ
jgi:ribose transport system ATP-binding protein